MDQECGYGIAYTTKVLGPRVHEPNVPGPWCHRLQIASSWAMNRDTPRPSDLESNRLAYRGVTPVPHLLASSDLVPQCQVSSGLGVHMRASSDLGLHMSTESHLPVPTNQKLYSQQSSIPKRTFQLDPKSVGHNILGQHLPESSQVFTSQSQTLGSHLPPQSVCWTMASGEVMSEPVLPWQVSSRVSTGQDASWMMPECRVPSQVSSHQIVSRQVPLWQDNVGQLGPVLESSGNIAPWQSRSGQHNIWQPMPRCPQPQRRAPRQHMLRDRLMDLPEAVLQSANTKVAESMLPGLADESLLVTSPLKEMATADERPMERQLGMIDSSLQTGSSLSQMMVSELMLKCICDVDLKLPRPLVPTLAVPGLKAQPVIKDMTVTRSMVKDTGKREQRVSKGSVLGPVTSHSVLVYPQITDPVMTSSEMRNPNMSEPFLTHHKALTWEIADSFIEHTPLVERVGAGHKFWTPSRETRVVKQVMKHQFSESIKSPELDISRSQKNKLKIQQAGTDTIVFTSAVEELEQKVRVSGQLKPVVPKSVMKYSEVTNQVKKSAKVRQRNKVEMPVAAKKYVEEHLVPKKKGIKLAVPKKKIKESVVLKKKMKEWAGSRKNVKEFVVEPLQEDSIVSKQIVKEFMIPNPLKKKAASKQIMRDSTTPKLLVKDSVLAKPMVKNSSVPRPLVKAAAVPKPMGKALIVPVTGALMPLQRMKDLALLKTVVKDSVVLEPVGRDSEAKEKRVVSELVATDLALQTQVVNSLVPHTSVIDSMVQNTPTNDLIPQSSVTDAIVPQSSVAGVGPQSSVAGIGPQSMPTDAMVPQTSAMDAVVPQSLAKDAMVPHPTVKDAMVPQSVVTNTAISWPVVTDTALPQPVVTDTAMPQPVVTDTALPRSVVTDTALPRPVVIDTALPQPVVTDTAMPQPVATDTILPRPEVTDTAMPQPVVNDTTLPRPGVTDTAIPLQGVTDTALPQPVVTDTAMPRPVATDTAMPRPVATDTAMPRPVATDTAMPRPGATDTALPQLVATGAASPQPTVTDTALQQPVVTDVVVPELTAKDFPVLEPLLIDLAVREPALPVLAVPELVTAIDLREPQTDVTDLVVQELSSVGMMVSEPLATNLLVSKPAVTDLVVLESLATDLVVPEPLTSDLVSEPLATDLVPEPFTSDLVVPEALTSDSVVPEALTSDSVVPEALTSDLMLPESLTTDLMVPELLATELLVPIMREPVTEVVRNLMLKPTARDLSLPKSVIIDSTMPVSDRTDSSTSLPRGVQSIVPLSIETNPLVSSEEVEVPDSGLANLSSEETALKDPVGRMQGMFESLVGRSLGGNRTDWTSECLLEKAEDKVELAAHRQLKLLLHARRCREKDQCVVVHCKKVKVIIQHTTRCLESKSCPLPHCTSSRGLMSHWDQCKVHHCPLCAPLRGCQPPASTYSTGFPSVLPSHRPASSSKISNIASSLHYDPFPPSNSDASFVSSVYPSWQQYRVEENYVPVQYLTEEAQKSCVGPNKVPYHPDETKMQQMIDHFSFLSDSKKCQQQGHKSPTECYVAHSNMMNTLHCKSRCNNNNNTCLVCEPNRERSWEEHTRSDTILKEHQAACSGVPKNIPFGEPWELVLGTNDLLLMSSGLEEKLPSNHSPATEITSNNLPRIGWLSYGQLLAQQAKTNITTPEESCNQIPTNRPPAREPWDQLTETNVTEQCWDLLPALKLMKYGEPTNTQPWDYIPGVNMTASGEPWDQLPGTSSILEQLTSEELPGKDKRFDPDNKKPLAHSLQAINHPSACVVRGDIKVLAKNYYGC